MRRLVIATFVVFVLTQIGCSPDCSTILPYWNIKGITSIELSQPSHGTVHSQIYNHDLLHLKCRFKFETLAQSSFHINNPFARTATAQSFPTYGGGGSAPRCQREGYEGMKDRITNITITSSKIYRGISAGNSINMYAKIPYCAAGGCSIQKFIAEEPYNRELDTDMIHTFELIRPQGPYEAVIRTFTITYEMESGVVYSSTSNPILWSA